MHPSVDHLCNNSALFRYGFMILMLANTALIFFGVEHRFYIVYVLATIFLGIGFHNRSSRFLITITTLVVLCRLIHDHYPVTIINFLYTEFTYLTVLYITVGFMRKNQRVLEDQKELISVLSKALDSRDTYTSGHSNNVSYYAVKIATSLGLPEDKIEVIRVGGLLHDIGKIGVPESILLKPGTLTEEEFGFIKKHPLIGYEMSKHVKHFQENGLLDIILYHHERYDGRGYPKGLKGDQIPLGARIIAIADSFDAMTSKRIYSPKVNIKDALLEIEKNKGTQFDPEIADRFIKLFKKQEGIVKLKAERHDLKRNNNDGSMLWEELG